MPDNTGDNKTGAVAAAGGSRPTETGPGAAGGAATGGGAAVPSTETLMGAGSVTGDAGSLDDTAGNSGDTVADEAKASAAPKMSPSGPDTEKNADAPSGGLGGDSSVGRS